MFPLGVLKKPSDPALTLALLHFDGANNSIVFTDSSPIPLTYNRAYSNNVISTTQSKFGGSSLYVGVDSGSGVGSVSDDRFLLSNQDFTIECWFYDSALSVGNAGIIGISERHSIVIDNGTIKANVFTGSNLEIIHQDAVSAATWNHVALVRHSGVITLYVNGVASNTNIAIGTTTLVNNSNTLKTTVGSYKGNVIGCFDGYIDEARVRREAVYTGNFTPPTAPFTF